MFTLNRLLAASLLTVLPVQAQQADDKQQLLHAIAVAPSPENIERDIAKLVSFGTRHTLSETESDSRGIGAARRWIKAAFQPNVEAVWKYLTPARLLKAKPGSRMQRRW